MLFPLLLLAFWQSGSQPEGNLITISVVATTNKGEPVTDFASADVRIKEDGKARPVAEWKFDGNRMPLGPTVIVLDRWNEKVMTSGAAWTSVRSGLLAVKPGDRVFLYFLDNRGEMVPVQPLPAPDDPRKDVEPSAAQLSAGVDAVMKASPGFRSEDTLDPVLSLNRTFQALTVLANKMAEFPGRKSLIWVTHGVPLMSKTPDGGFVDFTPQIKTLGTQFAQVQAALYLVDQSLSGAAADPNGASRAALQMLALVSGGRWFQSSAFAQTLAASLNDSRSSYILSYSSPVEDHKNHKIPLESARKGVHLLTREGYDGGFPPGQAPRQ